MRPTARASLWAKTAVGRSDAARVADRASLGSAVVGRQASMPGGDSSKPRAPQTLENPRDRFLKVAEARGHRIWQMTLWPRDARYSATIAPPNSSSHSAE